MLGQILSHEKCAECRLCCCFDKDDIWEAPIIPSALKNKIDADFGPQKYSAFGESYTFDMPFGDDGLAWCSVIGENGCKLGDNKPYDCKIWPFRIMEIGSMLALTVSPFCKAVMSLPTQTIRDFISDGFADSVFKTALENPDMIKKYIKGYIILELREYNDGK